MKQIGVLTVLAALPLLSFAEPMLVRDGKPTAVIVLENWRVQGAERYAAEELQRWLGEITGTHVPLRERETVADDVKTRVFVGAESARKAKLFAADFRLLHGEGRFEGAWYFRQKFSILQT